MNRKSTTHLIFFLVLLLGISLTDVFASPKPEAALKKIRERCIAILESALNHEEAFVRSGAVRAIGESEDPSLIPYLKKGAKDFYPTTRQFSLQAIEKISKEDAVRMATEALADTNIWVRSTALDILGEHGSSELIPRIREQLEVPDRMVRLAAAFALVRLGDRERFSDLLDAVKGGDAIHRYQAVTYLGKLATPPALDRLQLLLEQEPDDEILFYALKAVDKNVRIEMLGTLDRLLKHSNPRVRRQAVLLLANLPASAATDRLTPLCGDPDPMVKLTAALALNQLGLSNCQQVFDVSLQYGDAGIRSVAARVLGKTTVGNRAELLTQALHDPNSRVRTAAVRSTGMMGGAKGFQLLILMLDDSVDVIRAYAAGNLIRLMNP